MYCIQRLCSLVGRGIAVGALCVSMAGTSQALNIYLALGLEPISATNTAAATVGSLPTSFTNDGIAQHGATSVNGAVPYVIKLQPGLGSVITMNIVALIANNDGNHANDGITGGNYSLDSKPSAQNLKGNFSVGVLNPALTGFGSAVGTLADTDGDGDIDVGKNHTPTGTAAIPGVSLATISSASPSPYFPDAANAQTGQGFTKAILGTITFTVLPGDAVAGTFTNLELFPFVSSSREFAFTSDNGNNANFGGVAGAPFGFETWQSSLAARLYWLNGGLVPIAGATNAALVQTNDGILVQVVPEPGTIALMGLGMVGLVACVRRRRAA